MRPLFKGASYSFIPYKGAPIIQGRLLIKGAHYLRLYGRYLVKLIAFIIYTKDYFYDCFHYVRLNFTTCTIESKEKAL